MGKYILRRLLEAIPALLGVSLITFILLHMAPGDPVRLLLGDKYTLARAAALENRLGLNKPLWDQYVIWLWNLVHLNLGYSYADNLPVWTLIWQNLPRTLVLVGVAILVAHILAVVLGSLQAYYRSSIFDTVVTVFNYFFYAMPGFWLGIVLIQVFAINLGWFPSGGIVNPTVPSPTLGMYLDHLVLPALTLIVTSLAQWARYMRSSMTDTLLQDYIRTARAKGVSEPRVVFVHALRNSVLPLITLLGLSFPVLFGGALIVEEIFSYPGMGLLYWNAINSYDYPVILGIVMLLGAMTILGNLVADVIYGLVDVRIQYH